MAGLVYKAGYRKRSRSKKMRSKRMRNRPKGLKRSRKTSRRRSMRRSRSRSRSRTKGSKRRRSKRLSRKRRTKRGGVKFSPSSLKRRHSSPRMLSLPSKLTTFKKVSERRLNNVRRNHKQLGLYNNIKRQIKSSQKQKDLAETVKRAVGPAAVSAAAVVIKDTNWVGLFQGMDEVVGGIVKVLMNLGTAPLGLASRAVDILSHNQIALGAAAAFYVMNYVNINEYLSQRGKDALKKLRDMIPDSRAHLQLIKDVFLGGVPDELINAAKKLDRVNGKNWNELKSRVKYIMPMISIKAKHTMNNTFV